MKLRLISKLLFCMFLLPGILQAQGMTAEQILKRVDQVEKYDHAIAFMEQTITTSGGDKRLLKIKSWSVNTGDKQLAIYTYPKRIKGVKILMLNDGDDIWSYSPRTRRIRHLASHAKKQKVMGSDFTYEDMGGGKMSEKYTGKLLGEEDFEDVSCYVLDMVPTPKGPSYERIIAWIGKHDFVARKIDYFEKGDKKPFKTLFLRDVQNKSGHLVPMEMVMKNHEDGGTTKNLTLEIDFNTPIKADRFKSNRLNR